MKEQEELEMKAATQPAEEALVRYEPTQLIALAIERNLDTDKLRELMALEKEWRAEQAKAAYAVALAHFGRTKQVVQHNRRGKTAGNAPFTYADFPAMVKAITPWLTDCGLSFSHWQDAPVMTEGKISYIIVHCRIQHEAGHFEENEYPAIPDTRLDGKLSPSQLIQLAITYAKRQTLAMGLGLATSEDRSDSDSHGGEAPETIGEGQIADLEALIQEVKADKVRFLKWARVDSLADIRVSEYNRCITMLEQKRK